MSHHDLLFHNLLLIGINSSTDRASAGSAAGFTAGDCAAAGLTPYNLLFTDSSSDCAAAGSAGDFVAYGFAVGGFAADSSVAGGLQQVAL